MLAAKTATNLQVVIDTATRWCDCVAHIRAPLLQKIWKKCSWHIAIFCIQSRSESSHALQQKTYSINAILSSYLSRNSGETEWVKQASDLLPACKTSA